MEPLRLGLCTRRMQLPESSFHKESPRVDVAIDVDLPCVQSGMPWMHCGAQQFLVEGVVPLGCGPCITALHNPVEAGIEAIRASTD